MSILYYIHTLFFPQDDISIFLPHTDHTFWFSFDCIFYEVLFLVLQFILLFPDHLHNLAAAAVKSFQSCPTLCDPIDGSPPGSPVPGILLARILEWVAISFSNAWKWKVKGSRSVLFDSSWPHGLQPTRLLRSWDFPGKSTGVGCHCLLRRKLQREPIEEGLEFACASHSSCVWDLKIP